ncbi:MAG: hypothetical protein WCF55_22305 [Pseudolabrys sp.]
MPALLYGIGAFALFTGLLMIGFGIPINEFSFGNTLIGAGTTASVGGLIIIGLGVVAGQLRRVAEALAMPLPGRPVQPPELSESAAAPRPAPGRTPYPAKPPSAALDPMHAPAANPYEDKFEEVSAPRLRNPDISEVEEEISLSPPRPAMAPVKPPANDLSAFGRPSAGPPPTVATSAGEKNREAAWRSPPPTPSAPQTRPGANFDAMWPAEAKPKVPPYHEPQAETKVESISRDPLVATKRAELETKSRTVAVLKSGVVDGMAYTLYIDGSIEAELPQGTVRFASIHELRNHLAKNS